MCSSDLFLILIELSWSPGTDHGRGIVGSIGIVTLRLCRMVLFRLIIVSSQELPLPVIDRANRYRQRSSPR